MTWWEGGGTKAAWMGINGSIPECLIWKLYDYLLSCLNCNRISTKPWLIAEMYGSMSLSPSSTVTFSSSGTPSTCMLALHTLHLLQAQFCCSLFFLKKLQFTSIFLAIAFNELCHFPDGYAIDLWQFHTHAWSIDVKYSGNDLDAWGINMSCIKCRQWAICPYITICTCFWGVCLSSFLNTIYCVLTVVLSHNYM